MNIKKAELQINIIDILKYIFINWKICVLIAIIFMGGFSILGWSEDKKANEAIKYTLSQDEQSELSIYYEMKKEVEEYRRLKDEYAIMQLNPRTVCLLSAHYWVECEEYAIDAIRLLEAYLQEGSLLEEFAPPEYNSIIDLIDIYIYSDVDSEKTNLLAVKIYGKDKEFCASVLEVIEKDMEEFKNTVDTVHVTKIEKISEGYSIGKFTHVENKQADYEALLTGLEEQLSVFKQQFTPAQLYELGEVSVTNSSSSVVKFALIGCMIGIIVGMAFLSIRYLMDNTVKTEEEIEVMYGIPRIETVLINNSGLVCAKILALCRNLEKEFVISKIGEFSADERFDEVYKNLKVIGNITKDIQGVNELKKDTNLILYVKEKNTSRADIEYAIKYLKLQNISVVGYLYSK